MNCLRYFFCCSTRYQQPQQHPAFIKTYTKSPNDETELNTLLNKAFEDLMENYNLQLNKVQTNIADKLLKNLKEAELLPIQTIILTNTDIQLFRDLKKEQLIATIKVQKQDEKILALLICDPNEEYSVISPTSSPLMSGQKKSTTYTIDISSWQNFC